MSSCTQVGIALRLGCIPNLPLLVHKGCTVRAAISAKNYKPPAVSGHVGERLDDKALPGQLAYLRAEDPKPGVPCASKRPLEEGTPIAGYHQGVLGGCGRWRRIGGGREIASLDCAFNDIVTLA
jgi:hypothetical protein